MTIAANPPGASDIRSGRLDGATLQANFADLHPPLTFHEAKVEAERCYFCFDAPCQRACPTAIDIPLFIRQIAAGNRAGAAMTILDANIMGGTCSRVCPTETLCEEACVREAAEMKPVSIGQLQRYAVDPVIATGKSPYSRGGATGKRVAIVGAGPAGLACAHALAVAGIETTIYDPREKSGGLNEYGIAAYKMIDDFAAREAAFILSIGGIEVRHGQALGRDVTLERLRRDYDAVFLGTGLGSTNKLGLPRETELENVIDAVEYIARLRQAKDLSALPVGRRVLVIGGGMTAIDIAVQSKKLGAETVTMVYRRGPAQMKASLYERELAQTNGVVDPLLGASPYRSKAMPGRSAASCSRIPTITTACWPRPARSSESKPTCCSPRSGSAARRKRWTERRSRSKTAASSSTPSAAPASRASGPAATASTAVRI